jgi:sulfhydrogenase subunit alpha
MSRTISIDELTRVEGHGKILVTLDGREVKDVRMNIFEGPRFFESILKGVYYDKIPDIVRRICAICTASHSIASIRAIENAFEIEPTEQTKLLRDLLINGEMIESHSLHLFFLALPDFLGYDDIIDMTDNYLGEVESALALKKAGNMIHTILSGREVHGMNERVGGFSTIPSEEQLLKTRRLLEESMKTAELSVQLFTKADIPQYCVSKNNLMALNPGDDYGFIGEKVLTSDGEIYPITRYRELTNERTVKHSYAKFSSHKGESFMVGALPRIVLNGDKLRGRVKGLYLENQDSLDCGNSINNNLAQAIELLHSVERSIKIIDDLLDRGLKKENPMEVEAQGGIGVGAIEAPRGILYHKYSFDEGNRIIDTDIITPTAQNIANMEKDYRKAVENMIERPDKEIKTSLEIIARAYDPCISCSVHLVRV